MKKFPRILTRVVIGGALLAAALTVSQRAGAGAHNNSTQDGRNIPAAASSLPVLAQIAPVSTVPTNGDVNPYGVAFVPTGFPQGGTIAAGDILVSNFNNQANLQGTGSTIISRAPNGQTSLFFQGTPGLGLTTALGVLKKGFVLVGTLPTTDGTAATVHLGSLLILDSQGHLVTTVTDSGFLDSPWYLAIQDQGKKAQVFVSNVLSGTVVRLDLAIKNGAVTIANKTQIGSGYMHAPNAAALVVGPTGMALDETNDILYVASTGDNAVYAINNALTATESAGTGKVIYSDNTHLHGPLGLVLAPNGDLITSNGDAINADPNQNSEIVEFTTTGTYVNEFQIDPNPGGAFGIGLQPLATGFAQFAAVDDVPNTLQTWIIRTQ